jgi:hypothetical protein
MALQMCVIAMLACLSGSPVAQEASGLAEIQALGLDAALHRQVEGSVGDRHAPEWVSTRRSSGRTATRRRRRQRRGRRLRRPN